MSGYYSSYGQGYGSYYPDEWLLQIFAGLMVIVAIFALILCLALYIFRALGLYRIAKRRGIRCAWLAWIPVAGEWILGSISDQYQYVVKGRIKARRFVMVVLSAVTLALDTALFVVSEETIASALGRLMFGTGNVDVTRLVVVIGLVLLCVAARIAFTVFSLMAHYDLYSSCTAKYSVLYLVLGIFFRFLEPCFVFICREKDEGMPPRRPDPVWIDDEEVMPIRQESPLVQRLKEIMLEEEPEEEPVFESNEE